MKRSFNYIIAAGLFCAITLNGMAQHVDFKPANFKDKKEELKKATDGIKAGDASMEQGYEQMVLISDKSMAFYNQAIFQYQPAQDLNPNNSELNFKIGACLLYTNRKAEAPEYFEKAKKLGGPLPKDFNFYYAQALLIAEKYDESSAALKKFEGEASGKQIEELGKFVKKFKAEAKSAKALTGNPERAWIDNLKSINSPQDDYSPCITTDGELLMFASRRKNNHEPNAYGLYDADIYTCEWKDGKWTTPKPENTLNSINDDVSATLSYDGQSMLLFADNGGQSDVYESFLSGRTWGAPKSKAKAINTEYNQSFSSYSFDGVKIYYVTDQKGGGGKAGNDIFFSGRMAMGNGQYGKGQTAGSKVNTKWHEGSVYMTPDGNTMYFSSQGHNSMGGYDIFKSTRYQGQWQDPVNLGYPINSPADDLFFAVTANGKFAYVASNRANGAGGFDLYKVTFWGPEKQVIFDTEDNLLASIAAPVQEASLEKAVEVEKKSLTVFKGKIIDAITKDPLEANLEIMDIGKKEVTNTFKSNSATGKFLLSLPAGFNYGITVAKDGYLFHSENFNLPADDGFNMVNKTVELYNIRVGSKIALRNVFFATGKSDITSDSYPELDRLVQLLKDVPGLEIELSGHTDNVGSEEMNKKLSGNRAQAVVDYLVGKGIKASRMTAKGYGSSKPVATNKTAEGRQENRRTEFLITAN